MDYIARKSTDDRDLNILTDEISYRVCNLWHTNACAIHMIEMEWQRGAQQTYTHTEAKTRANTLTLWIVFCQTFSISFVNHNFKKHFIRSDIETKSKILIEMNFRKIFFLFYFLLTLWSFGNSIFRWVQNWTKPLKTGLTYNIYGVFWW